MIVGSVLVADRYIKAVAGEDATKNSKGKIFEANFNANDIITIALKSDASRTELEEAYLEALHQLRKRHPGIKALSAGSCVSLKSCVTDDRNVTDPDLSGYGVISNNAMHASWEGANLYALSTKVFPEIADDIYVRADVSLAAMGEFYWRLKEKKLASFDEMHRYGNKDLTVLLRNITMSYVKLSADVNGAFIYNGNLFGGKNHPFLSLIRPRRMEQFVDAERKYIRDDFPGVCVFHRDCYSGLISVGALERRLSESQETRSLVELPSSHGVWGILAYYTAQLCMAIIATHVPSLIVLGGRLVKDQANPAWPKNDIIEKVRTRLAEEIKTKMPDYPELHRPDGFIQEAACQWPVLYGGLIFSIKHDGEISYLHNHHAG